MAEAAVRDPDEKDRHSMTTLGGPQADEAPEPQPQAQHEPTAPPQGTDSLDLLLAEYDQGIKDRPQQTEQPEPQFDPLQEQKFNNALSAVDREIEAKARGFYEQELQKAELARAFENHVAGIQAKCPDHCPEGYARDALVAMAASDHRLEVAFRAASQGVNKAAIMAELDRINGALQHAARDATANPAVIPQLQQMAWQLSVAFHAPTILKQAEAEIVRRANARPPIDRDLTEDALAVAASMRGSSRPVEAEPPPRFGHMSEGEFKRFTRENYGF
jgi:hypothetical protein